MADDFDDLYNVYNGDGKDYEYNDEDLYGGDAFDLQEEMNQTETTTKEEDSDVAVKTEVHQDGDESQPQQHKRKPQQQQQQQQKQMRYSPQVYQQYFAAFQQNLQQQMMMNQYMMQSQYYQNNNMPQQYYKQQQQNRVEPKRSKEETVDDDDRKLFVGGLNWETTEDKLRDYFSQFGQVVECSILRDPNTQRSRGFGFLTMEDSSIIDKIVHQDNHVLDGKKIDPKRAISRDEQDKAAKIFVGGISIEVSEEELRKFFSQFGTVIDATLMMERDTGRSRGFGFVTFESSEGVEKVLEQPRLSIKDKSIDVKKAMPRGKHQQLQQQRQFQSYIPNGFMGANNMMYNPYQMQAYYQQQQQQQYNKQHSSRHYKEKDDHHSRGDSRNKHDGGGGKLHSSKNQQHYRPY